MTTYTTKQGDTWDIISKTVYDDESYMNELIRANFAYINIVIFSAGVVLTIPDITTITEDETLPAWKRGA